MFDDMTKTIPDIIFHQGLPSMDDIQMYSENEGDTIFVPDDLMLQIVQSEELVTLFTITSHHRNITVIYLAQNLYPPGKYSPALRCTFQKP